MMVCSNMLKQYHRHAGLGKKPGAIELPDGDSAGVHSYPCLGQEGNESRPRPRKRGEMLFRLNLEVGGQITPFERVLRSTLTNALFRLPLSPSGH